VDHAQKITRKLSPFLQKIRSKKEQISEHQREKNECISDEDFKMAARGRKQKASLL
jgi:hypothetical protein